MELSVSIYKRCLKFPVAKIIINNENENENENFFRPDTKKSGRHLPDFYSLTFNL